MLKEGISIADLKNILNANCVDAVKKKINELHWRERQLIAPY
jgi:hypothetical protein